MLVRPTRLATVMRRGLATTAHTQSIRSIKPGRDEKASGRLTQRNMQQALEALTHDGIVMLEDVVDHEAIDKLDRVMRADAQLLMNMGDDGPFNYNKGNIQQSPPLNDPSLIHPSIFFNPLATHVTSSMLGGRPTMSFISGNTAIDASCMDDAAKAGQPVHTDADFDHPTIPFACVVNVGLTRMHPGNGSTEIWKGTHTHSGLHVQEGAHGERASGRIKAELLAQRRGFNPPFQPDVPKGALLIRDLRLWHAGRANLTPPPRVMLAFIHFAPWYRQQMSLDVQHELRPVFDEYGTELNLPVNWQEHVNHLDGAYGNAFSFDQDP